MGGGPFIIPQKIFDASTLATSGALTPNAVQDSGNILVAASPAITTVLAASLGVSQWLNILAITIMG
jgi:hypothetical protein